MKLNLIKALSMGFALCLILVQPASAEDKKQAVQEKVAAFKQSMAENKKALGQYTWKESTQLSLKGEVKSTKVEQCRYEPDGKVRKTPLSAPPEKKEMRGLKKKSRREEDRRDEGLHGTGRGPHQTVCPAPPELIKADVAGGNASLSPQGDGAIQLQFKNFVKSGDLVSFTLDTAAKADPPGQGGYLSGRCGQGQGGPAGGFHDSAGWYQLRGHQEFERGGQEDRGQHHSQ